MTWRQELEGRGGSGENTKDEHAWAVIYMNDVGKWGENRRNIVGRTGLGSNHFPDQQQRSYL